MLFKYIKQMEHQSLAILKFYTPFYKIIVIALIIYKV